MNDFNSQGRPAKRPRDSSCPPPASGSRDSYGPEPRKYPGSKSMAPPRRVYVSVAGTFQSLKEQLKLLDGRDPVHADQVTNLVMIYRRLWDSYTASHTENSRLEKDNQRLQTGHARLVEEKDEMERRSREPEQHVRHFKEAIQKFQDGLKEVFEQWEKTINMEPSKEASTKEDGAVAGAGPSAP